MSGLLQIEGSDRSFRLVVDKIDGGLNTRTFPHLILDNQLFVADNVVFMRDGLASKRPGNAYYGLSGGGNGQTGSGTQILNMTRFYFGNPSAGQLLVHSGTHLYKGNDATGAFTSLTSGLTSTRRANFAQTYDPDMTSGAATALVVVDGVHVPALYDGTNYVSVQTGSSGGTSWLPNGLTGSPITPRYVVNWGPVLVYAGDPTDPTAIYISDTLRPERFNGYAIIDSANTTYTAYYPGGRNSALGIITGLTVVNGVMVITYSSGIVVGLNSGTYGAFQFTFNTISANIGNVAENSLVNFGPYAIFFGGDKFYATDAQTIVSLPDLVPSVYGNTSSSIFPAEMNPKTVCCGVKRGSQYWAGYDIDGNGSIERTLVFDTSANGGWNYYSQSSYTAAVTGRAPNPNQAGGAWSRWPSGMPVQCGVECVGPGDNFQMFWGSGLGDVVAQHDVGTWDDFGASIAVQVQTKSFYLDRPVWPKTVECMYVLGIYQASGTQYTDMLQPYVVYDQSTQNAPFVNQPVGAIGTQYGTSLYGTFLYASGNQIAFFGTAGYPGNPQVPPGTLQGSVALGVSESSTNPFNVLGFVAEIVIDNPQPLPSH